VTWTAEALIAFENEIEAAFNRGEIKSPVHLAGGNEQQLIDIFRHIRPQDWVCGTWRSHYHCLLKGVPPGLLRDAIRAGRSIALCFPAERVICSAMVGGIAPIALGLAWAAKRARRDETVYCFLGDMADRTGLVEETMRYAGGHDLPIWFIIEDNGLSVATRTAEVWGDDASLAVRRYDYVLTRPHVGTGRWVSM